MISSSGHEKRLTVGILSPSSPVNVPDFELGLRTLHRLGFETVLGSHVYRRNGHLAGTDNERADDIFRLYSDPDVDIIWSSRGGSSSCRILEPLPWALMQAMPKKSIVGYSDVTSLLVAFDQLLGVNTIHGPMVSELGHLSEIVLGWILKLVTTPEICAPIPARFAQVLLHGKAIGTLTGGCLSLLAASVGTPFAPDFDDRIVFMEDIDSQPWQIERDLWQLGSAGLLSKAAAFIVGEATNTDDADTLPIRQIWSEMLLPYNKPTVLGFEAGHIPRNFALPFGRCAQLDTQSGILSLLK